MADPFTPAFLAANCIWGVIQNRADAAAASGVARLTKSLRKSRTLANDILEATHSAFVRSIQFMADACERTGGEANDQFSARALTKLASQHDFITYTADTKFIQKKELDYQIRAIFDGNAPDPAANATETVIALIESAIGGTLTEAHRNLFRCGSSKYQSWAHAFTLFFAEQVKENEHVFRALAFDRLNEIASAASKHARELYAMNLTVNQFQRSISFRLDGMDEKLEEILARLSARSQDAPITLLRSLAEAFGKALPTADVLELETYLRGKINDYHTLRARIENIRRGTSRDASLLDNAKLAIIDGDFERADELLSEAERLLDERLDQLLAQKAERRSLRGEAARLKGDYATAIAHYDAAARFLPAESGAEWIALKSAAASAAHEWGERLCVATALIDAASRWEEVISHARTRGYDNYYAVLQNNLGNSLLVYGERSGESSSLLGAVRAYRLAVANTDVKGSALSWAQRHMNLATALKQVGIRCDDSEMIEEAISAYRTSLSRLKKGRDRATIADVEVNLSDVLRAFGEARNDIRTLREAVSRAKSALRAYTSLGDDTKCAQANVQLGNALFGLGWRLRSGSLIEAAVCAYRNVLGLVSKQRVPDMWALAQNNLGNAIMASCVEAEDQPHRLREAIAAYRESLEIFSPDSTPLDWAMATENLGRALSFLGLKTGSCERAQEAVPYLEDALEVYSKLQLALRREMTERALDRARAIVAQCRASQG